MLALKCSAETDDRALGDGVRGALDAARCSVEAANALIAFHDHFDDGVRRALHIFERIGDGRKTSVSVNAAMKVLLRRNARKRALALYDAPRHRALLDTVSNMLALRPCCPCGAKRAPTAHRIVARHGAAFSDDIVEAVAVRRSELAQQSRGVAVRVAAHERSHRRVQVGDLEAVAELLVIKTDNLTIRQVTTNTNPSMPLLADLSSSWCTQP